MRSERKRERERETEREREESGILFFLSHVYDLLFNI